MPIVAEGLFTWPSESPQLIGARCNDCGTIVFPSAGSCSKCAGVSMSEHLLSRTGTLWTWTIQGFLPKSPPYAGTESVKDFVPYGVGYVDLPGEVKVETRLTTADPKQLKIGMPVELVIVPFTKNAEGHDVLTFAFAPASHTTSSEA